MIIAIALRGTAKTPRFRFFQLVGIQCEKIRRNRVRKPLPYENCPLGQLPQAVTSKYILDCSQMNIRNASMSYQISNSVPTCHSRMGASLFKSELNALLQSALIGALNGINGLARDIAVEVSWGSVPNVVMQPFTLMCRWSVYQAQFADGTLSCHLVGTVKDEARVTTAVHSICPNTKRVVTESGRIYQLDRDFGNNFQADYLFKAWSKENGVVKVFNKTQHLVSTLEKKASAFGGFKRSFESTVTNRYSVSAVN
jgi:hypothetical protein